MEPPKTQLWDARWFSCPSTGQDGSHTLVFTMGCFGYLRFSLLWPYCNGTERVASASLHVETPAEGLAARATPRTASVLSALQREVRSSEEEFQMASKAG